MTTSFRFFSDLIAAPNTPSGNPNRAYLIRHMPTGDVCAVYRHDHGGWEGSVPDAIRSRCRPPLVRFNMRSSEVNSWVRSFENPPIATILAESDQIAEANPYA